MNRIKKIPIKDLVKADWNYKKEDSVTSDRLRNAISKRGQLVLTLVRDLGDGRYEIVNGNHGYDIYSELGYSEVECIDLGDITIDEAKQIALETNELRFANDEIKLGGLLKELKEKYSLEELTMSLPYKPNEIDLKIENYDIKYNKSFGDDSIPEAPSITKAGDLWELGRHRVLCSDCTNRDNLDKLMRDIKADMVFNDPPYDMEIGIWFYDFIKNNMIKGNIFVMHSDLELLKMLKISPLKFKHFFIADLNVIIPKGLNPYQRHILVSHEYIGKVKNKNLYDGFSTRIKCPYRRNLDEEIMYKHQKSVSFIESFILHFSEKNNIIVDLFLGSGSTLIASDKNNRVCYGMEILEKNVDIIVKRYYDWLIINNNPLDIKLNGKKFNPEWEKKEVKK